MNPDFNANGNLSNEELLEIIDNRQRYMPETVESSIAELQHRGYEFSDEELKIFSEDIQAQRQNALLVDGRLGLFNNSSKNVIIEDPNAPLLYSRQALYTFTFLFGAFFGSIMMAINLSKTERKNTVLWVILFGIGFTALQAFIIDNYANSGSAGSGAILGGIIAAYILDLVFWKNFIGYATFYRARPIWVPLIIAIAIASLMILAVIYAPK